MPQAVLPDKMVRRAKLVTTEVTASRGIQQCRFFAEMMVLVAGVQVLRGVVPEVTMHLPLVELPAAEAMGATVA
jgi:hypothetical protein